MPIHSPLDPPNFTMTTFIECCSCSNPGRSDAAADFLRSLPTFNVVIWTDDSVPSPLGAGGASVQAACRRCSFSSSLSYSAGPVSSSFSAESLALVHGLKWCNSHLKAFHFQSALFLTDFQSALAVLCTAPAFLQPKFFWDIWDLSDSHSFRVALSFQWVPSHAGLPGNELTDSLTKTEATLPFTHVPRPLAPTVAKIRHTRYSLKSKSFS